MQYLKNVLFAVAALVAAVALLAAADEQAAEKPVNAYVGDNGKNCAMCHKAQVEAWKTWAMASSWTKLSAEEQKKDECIKCHVTGFGQPGGWVSFEKTPNLVGIQCEACHGPAGDHMKAPMTDKEKKKATVVVAPPESACLVCHVKEGNPNFKEFKFEEAKAQLANHFPAK